jgi:hypothetical protein
MISTSVMGPFPFSMTPAQAKAIKNKLLGEPRSYWPSVLILTSVLIQAASWGVQARRHGVRIESIALLAMFVIVFAGVIAMFVVFVRQRRRPIPLTGSLTVADGGFEGILDGAPTTIRWSEIAGAQDIDTAIVIRQRRGGMIAIPKADVDAAALWSILEDHLIAKRGLIRSASARRIITNTAC